VLVLVASPDDITLPELSAEVALGVELDGVFVLEVPLALVVCD